ncbi:MAG TPA: hypothetical protein DCF91_06455 [Porphyromonadaceae bacterium]|nr:hypothetical protein [Porphyromonadaceae bacterium]
MITSCFFSRFSTAICYLFLASTACSCTFTSDLIEIKQAKLFQDSDFGEAIHLQHEVYNDDFIGNPFLVKSIGTTLYAIDNMNDPLIHVFDQGRYKGQIIKKGQGPNEAVSPFELSPSFDGESIWIYDNSTQRWLEFSGKAIAKEMKSVVTDKIEFTKNNNTPFALATPFWITSSQFICTNPWNHEDRFYIIDRTTMEKKGVQNPHITFTDQLPASILSIIFDAKMTMKPDRSKVALAGNYLDAIEIFNVNGEILNTIKGPEDGFNFAFDEAKSLEMNILSTNADTKKAYVNICSTNQYIYALYSGKRKGGESNYNLGNCVYVFDWNGKPVKKYLLDQDLIYFDINEKEQRLYAVSKPDNYIMYYDLKE